MAPRPLESFSALVARAKESVTGGRNYVCFGGHHWDAFALCAEDGRVCVRKMQVDEAAHAAFLEEHGYFMPENVHAVSRPGEYVLEAPTLQELFQTMSMPEHRETWGLR